MYCSIIQAMMSYGQGDKKAALAYTEAVFEHLRKLILYLYDNMNDPNVSRAIWVRHVSGIHSWGLTSDSENGPIEYGGLSGSQTLIFLSVDAFLGIASYHSDDETKMHISKNMRNVYVAMQRHCFRPSLAKGGSVEDLAIGEVMDRIVKQMRVRHHLPSTSFENFTYNMSPCRLFAASTKFEPFASSLRQRQRECP